MLTESTQIFPLEMSTIRNSPKMMEDFPDPVRPIIPIFSEDLVSKLRPFTEGSKCSLQTHNTYVFLEIWSEQ